MATSSTTLVTVAEFRKLEDPPGVRLELHNGEVVEVTRPKLKHWKIQKRLTAIFDEALRTQGEAGYEFPFRAKAEHELRVADVAWISRARFEAIDEDDNLIGSPEIVAEVLSPSNTASEMIEKRNLCLTTGCQQFWIIDPERRLIEIAPLEEAPSVYRGADRVALGNTSYSVDEILGN